MEKQQKYPSIKEKLSFFLKSKSNVITHFPSNVFNYNYLDFATFDIFELLDKYSTRFQERYLLGKMCLCDVTLLLLR